ncbi:MAG: hypothetical protein EDQ89_08285 [Acidobacteria bacterium]|nr:MAG: hypothetical protein EDQ89_08285 [Acidobacteriota bacterium]
MQPTRSRVAGRSAGTAPDAIGAIARTAVLLAVAATLLVPAIARAGGGIAAGGGTGGGPGKAPEASAISGVPRAYARFTVIVVRRTGLSARVVGAWTLAEGGPDDNPLNIGPGERFGTVRRGARATAKHLRGDLYRDVMNTVGRSDMAQIDAIAASPWCYRCKGYRRLLRSTYSRVRVDD